MDDKNEGENNNKIDEIMLPGFRFHPTDEELVGFYLKRKIQQQPLAIELIKQLDIYKYDPWDLPKFASTGEKEWYFYCPRDRKYRNSARPNRVTGAGFWKATGTDRPIYSSEGNKCIGLKKSLVFYKGRAAKGVKTDWMMHEFRLPSLGDSLPSRRCVDANLPANDSWAICRIFKKTSPITPRTLSHSWASPSLHDPSPCNLSRSTNNTSQFSTKDINVKTCNSPPMQLNSNDANEIENNILQSPNTFSFLDIPTFKPIYHTSNANNKNDHPIPNIPTMLDLPPSYMLPQLEDPSEPSKSNVDMSSMLLSMSSTVLGDFNKPCDGNMEFGVETNFNGQNHDFAAGTLSQDSGDHYQDYYNVLMGNLDNMMHANHHEHHQWGGIETIGSIPIAELLPLALPDQSWKSSTSLLWDCAPLS